MKWYLAKLIYHIICGDGNHTPQFEEQLRLINATDALAAIQKAQQIGHKEQQTFFNDKQRLVQWKFIDVNEVSLLDKLEDGMEIYSRICEQENADMFILITRLKAEQLLRDNLMQAVTKN
jgi:hypothetical protein